MCFQPHSLIAAVLCFCQQCRQPFLPSVPVVGIRLVVHPLALILRTRSDLSHRVAKQGRGSPWNRLKKLEYVD